MWGKFRPTSPVSSVRIFPNKTPASVLYIFINSHSSLLRCLQEVSKASTYVEVFSLCRSMNQPVEKLCLGLMWLAADFFNRQATFSTSGHAHRHALAPVYCETASQTVGARACRSGIGKSEESGTVPPIERSYCAGKVA